MKYIPQSIPNIILIQPEVHGDSRGYFLKLLNKMSLRRLLDERLTLFKTMSLNPLRMF